MVEEFIGGRRAYALAHKLGQNGPLGAPRKKIYIHWAWVYVGI